MRLGTKGLTLDPGCSNPMHFDQTQVPLRLCTAVDKMLTNPKYHMMSNVLYLFVRALCKHEWGVFKHVNAFGTIVNHKLLRDSLAVEVKLVN